MLQTKTKVEVHPDSYYEDASRAAIETALAESEGKTPAEIRHDIRRNYPFSNGDRKGREYKVWNQLVHETETKLGLPKQVKSYTTEYTPPKRQTPTKAKLTRSMSSNLRDLPSTKEEFLRTNPSPDSKEQAAVFLRKHCQSAIFMLEDHDVLKVDVKLRDVSDHKLKWQYVAELRTADPDEWNRVYIEAAQKAYDVWVDVVLELYKSPRV